MENVTFFLNSFKKIFGYNNSLYNIVKNSQNLGINKTNSSQSESFSERNFC